MVSPTPTTAERIRSACVRAGGAMLAVEGLDPTATPVHHLLDDGSFAITVPVGGALAATVVSAGNAGIQAVLEMTDYAPLPLREPVRSLVWIQGRLRDVPMSEVPGLLDLIATAHPSPALLQVNSGPSTDESDTSYALMRLEIESVVAADSTGAESVALNALLGARPDPFCAMESCWLQHMESAHRDVVDRLATRLPTSLRRGRVRPLGLDRYGVQLRVEGEDVDHDVRLPFAKPVDDVTGLSQAIRVLMGCPFLNGLRAGRLHPQGTQSPATVAAVSATDDELTEEQRRGLRIEIAVVLAVTFALSAYTALLSLIEAVLLGLSGQIVALNPKRSPFDLIDLGLNLAGLFQLLAWGALAVYLLWRTGDGPARIGLARIRSRHDVLGGVGLALVIGVPGLALYQIARFLELNASVEPAELNDTWWRIPVLLLMAFGNAWAEEVVMVGFLLTRLRQLKVNPWLALAISSLLRGTYHLYQGFGAGLGNVAMGLVFGYAWQRTGRLWPLIIAHALIDAVAFVGYSLLAGHLGWLL